MKGYEHVSRNVLTRRTPAILRVDGKAFHTFTRGFDVPFDNTLHNAMVETAEFLVREIQGAKVAYTQSDEISVLITDYDTLTTDAWFGYGIQKMASVAASAATVAFNRAMLHHDLGLHGHRYCSDRSWAQFDARVFNVPKEEVVNYFVWRQQDATRNSIQMVARSEFSHRECHKKSTNDLQDMLMTERGVNWNDIPTHFKRGFCVIGTDGIVLDREIPIFTQDREYLERFVHPDLTPAT